MPVAAGLPASALMFRRMALRLSGLQVSLSMWEGEKQSRATPSLMKDEATRRLRPIPSPTGRGSG
ncbi:protein of unknown function [Enterobacter cancerogenus]|nr:protein of unknown function [Enterobacter cancerogenus]